jgi:two-component system NarL family sensor kinase
VGDPDGSVRALSFMAAAADDTNVETMPFLPGVAGAPVVEPEVPDGRVRVALGHHSAFVRDGLLLALAAADGIHVVGVVSDLAELLALSAGGAPDLLLVPPELVPAEGPAAVVVLVDSLTDDRVGDLYVAGARAVVGLDVGRERLVQVLHRVARGERVVLDDAQDWLTRPPSRTSLPGHPVPLPPRDIARGLAAHLHEGLVLTAAGRLFIAVSSLLVLAVMRSTVAHPGATLLVSGLLMVWALTSVAFVRRPPPVPLWVGGVVDLVLATALGAAFSDTRAMAAPLSIMLIVFALRGSPRLLLGAATIALGALLICASGFANGVLAPTAGALVASGLVSVMVADVRDRREREVSALVLARRELLAESLSAERRARRLIAEELHDDPLQLLLAAKQELDERDFDPEAVTRAADLVAQASVRFRAVMQRSSAHAPTSAAGLQDALERLCERQARRGGYAWTVAVGPGIDPVLHELLLAIAGELVGNVTKHAAATLLTVRLRVRRDGVELAVADDGQGIADGRTDAAAELGHLGLRSSRGRVEAADGTFTLSSVPGAGTDVIAWLPSGARR